MTKADLLKLLEPFSDDARVTIDLTSAPKLLLSGAQNPHVSTGLHGEIDRVFGGNTGESNKDYVYLICDNPEFTL